MLDFKQNALQLHQPDAEGQVVPSKPLQDDIKYYCSGVRVIQSHLHFADVIH